MGEVGVDIADPDAPALDILNEILNSFGGKLFNEIRSKEVRHCNLYQSFGSACACFNEFPSELSAYEFNDNTGMQGLAYSVAGGFNTSTVDHKGLFVAGGETASVTSFISSLERSLQVSCAVNHPCL